MDFSPSFFFWLNLKIQTLRLLEINTKSYMQSHEFSYNIKYFRYRLLKTKQTKKHLPPRKVQLTYEKSFIHSFIKEKKGVMICKSHANKEADNPRTSIKARSRFTSAHALTYLN